MTTNMIVRVEPELKARVSQLARAEGKNTSQVVRDLLEDYVRDRDIGAYIDDLWDRMGKKMKARGITHRDIARAIRDVRRERR